MQGNYRIGELTGKVEQFSDGGLLFSSLAYDHRGDIVSRNEALGSSNFLGITGDGSS